MIRLVLPTFAALALAGCTLTELESPQSGSCDELTAQNRWPQFEGSDGEPPLVTDNELGWNKGDIPPDFQLTDQFGEPVCLWQMAGKHVVLDSSALWCEPCKQIAETLPCQSEAYGDDVVFMTFIIQGIDSNPSTDEDAVAWSDAFGLGDGHMTPVMNDSGLVVVDNLPGGGVPLPTVMLLDPDLRVVTSGPAASTEPKIHKELEKALGITVDHCLHHE